VKACVPACVLWCCVLVSLLTTALLTSVKGVAGARDAIHIVTQSVGAGNVAVDGGFGLSSDLGGAGGEALGLRACAAKLAGKLRWRNVSHLSFILLRVVIRVKRKYNANIELRLNRMQRLPNLLAALGVARALRGGQFGVGAGYVLLTFC